MALRFTAQRAAAMSRRGFSSAASEQQTFFNRFVPVEVSLVLKIFIRANTRRCMIDIYVCFVCVHVSTTRSSDKENALFHAQVYPLVFAIGGAVLLCAGACTRYVVACPDVSITKSSRSTLLRGEGNQEGGSRFSSHRHGWDTGGFMFSNGAGKGKKNYESVGSGSVKIFE